MAADWRGGLCFGAVWTCAFSAEPRPAFTPAREADSRHLPLPPDNWLELHDRAEQGWVIRPRTPQSAVMSSSSMPLVSRTKYQTKAAEMAAETA